MTLENEDDLALFRWFPIPPALMVDVTRVNINDLINPRLGQIIRVNGMDGPAIVPLHHGGEKFYPIEDEL